VVARSGPRRPNFEGPNENYVQVVNSGPLSACENVIAGTDCRLAAAPTAGRVSKAARAMAASKKVVDLNRKVPVRMNETKSKKVWK
jgi:hypothetical protein